jgi:hypothetical protein
MSPVLTATFAGEFALRIMLLIVLPTVAVETSGPKVPEFMTFLVIPMGLSD